MITHKGSLLRWMLSVLPAMSMVALPLTACAENVAPIDIQAHLKPIPLSARKGNPVSEVGGLVYRGGVRIISSERRLGGLSGLVVSQDGAEFLSVSDQADWVRGKLEYTDGRLSGVSGLSIGAILDEKGDPLVNKQGDAEAVEQIDPTGPFPGQVIVAFERQHRLWRYDVSKNGFAARPVDLRIPTDMRSIEDNQGIESLFVIDGNQVVAISEGTVDDDGRTMGWMLQLNKDRLTVGQSRPLFLETWKTFRPTDLTRLPDGRFLLLQRHFSPRTGPIIQVRDLGQSLPEDEVTISGSLLAEMDVSYNIDNMEGLAARQTEDGRTLIYMVSDDNFNPLQRTLLLMFEVTPLPEVEPAEEAAPVAEQTD